MEYRLEMEDLAFENRTLQMDRYIPGAIHAS